MRHNTLDIDDTRDFVGWTCAKCGEPLAYITDENDYMCAKHGFVNAVRPDGAVIAGDGRPGNPRIIEWCKPQVTLT